MTALAATLAHYVGPNLQDRFDLKHARLLNHQLGLSARDEFASLGFEGPWRAELFVKGRLFYRDGDRSLASNLPLELAGDHLRSWWKTASEWRDSKGDRLFASLPRLGWMAERTLSAEEGEALVEQTAVLSERVATLPSPIMVARYERCERYTCSECATGDVWREHSRGFIVPDEWPERAADFAG